MKLTLSNVEGDDIGRITQIAVVVKLGNSVYVAQMRLRWYAQAVAAERLDTPSLSKMLLT